MIPILYPSTETAFADNGLGMLSDAAACYVDCALNGAYELELRYPVAGARFSDLALRGIVLAAPDPESQAQPFRIYRITKALGGLVTVYARHLAYDLQGITVAPFAAVGAPAALAGLKANAVTSCPFDFSTDKTDTTATMAVQVPTAIWSQLGGQEGSVLDQFGGEYEFDRFAVKLHTRRGQNRGVSIRYGKNLTSLQQDENCASCYTGVYPYWISADGDLVQLEQRVVYASGTFDYVKILPLDLSQEWEEAPTGAQLLARAQRYITDNEIGVPAVSWDVSFVQLEQTQEYKGQALLERVALGDQVEVIFPALGVQTTARAVSTRYNVLLDRFESVTLGSIRSNIATTIADTSATAQENADKIFVESQTRASEDKKLSASLTIESNRITAEVAARQEADKALQSTLDIQAGQIAAKVSQTGGDASSFGWRLLADSWTVQSNGVDVFQITKDRAKFAGTIEAADGKIGNWDIGADCLSFRGQTYGGSVINGAYIGSSGIQVGVNFQVDNYGNTRLSNLYADSGTFEGAVYAGNIQYGGDYGTMSGSGVTSHSISGSRLAYNTVSTSYTSTGINTSLGYADFANGVFNGVNTANYLRVSAGRLYVGDYSGGWRTINYVDHNGTNRSARVLVGQ